MAHMWNMPEISIIKYELNTVNNVVLQLLLTTAILVLSFNIIKNGFKNLIHKTPNMDTLVMMSVLASFLFSTYSMVCLINGNIKAEHATVYFETVAMVLFFVEIGKYIENKNINQTKEALKRLVTITPQRATIIKDGDEKEVTLDEIRKDDIVICRPGEKIAVDGEIIEGTTHIDESFITGESIPVKKEKGMKVIAGSINFEGSIRYKAEKIGKESTISEIVKMCVEATNTKAPISKLVDKISGIFVPLIIIIAILSSIIWWFITKDISVSINTFVSVLVVACPCSLGLATPLVIVVASGVLLNKGILVKSSDCIENAGKMKNILFDKTGTLTKGILSVSRVIKYCNEDEASLLKYIASVEKKSEHPISKAVVEYAKENGAMIVAAKDYKTIPGQGVYGKVSNEEIYIGNQKLVNELNIKIPNKKDEEELSKQGNSILYVIKSGEVVALIGVKDIVKDEASNLVSSLNDLHINSVMLTGDNDITANVIASEIGITSVISNCSPKEKSEKVKEYKKDGITSMCGDGINDSVSLINADIGISVSNGTDVSIDSANVVLLKDNLLKIIDLIKVSKKSFRVIKQNLFWAFIYNVVMVLIACGVFRFANIEINPMLGSFMMMLSSIIVVLNSLRLKLM